ncbi:hypothetical protein KYC5002_42045 [Archangium violaceum]|uniref:DUF7948 domain-containing protein n=1 Tax=Archangium violaceum TaxID=83451 RepID=UPI002B2A0740|nr:hypothetical protein KYC5002_42045 [Archangium gephyra]
MGIAPVPVGSPGRYELRSSRGSAVFGETGLTLHLPSRLQQARELGWRVAGARAVKPQVEQPRVAKLHRLVGPRSDWERDVPTYGALRYRGVLPGVDLWFEERAEGHEYGFRAERGADLRRVQLEYAGARAVRVVEEGRALEVALGEGVLREQGLRCTQEAVDGTARVVGCRFTDARPVGLDRWEYAIEVDVEDPERPVVVDPLVLWNTYLGGELDDALLDIEQSEAGDLFIVGTVLGPPKSPAPDAGTLGGPGGSTDVLVARFQRDGGLAWSTLLGGSGDEVGAALSVGASNEVYVAGVTKSADFQVLLADGGVRSSLKGSSDGFVARLSSTGRTLEWLLHVGGSGEDELRNMVRAPSGMLFVTGNTRSDDLPNPVGAKLPVSTWDGFAARVDPAGPQTDWSLYIQSPDEDRMYDIAFRSQTTGILYVTGSRLQGTAAGDAILATISGASASAGTKLQSVIPIGGSGLDQGRALVLTPEEVQVWGTTESNDFPDAGGFKKEADLFVAVFPDWFINSSMPQSRALRFGGSLRDELRTATMDSAGNIYVGGVTYSRDFPVPGGFDTRMQPDDVVNGFVARARIDPELSVDWGSYVGGLQYDEVFTLRADNQQADRLFIGGRTSSTLDYSDAGYNPGRPGGDLDMLLMAVEVIVPPDAGPGGGGEGEDGGDGGADAGDGGGDGGTDGGDGGPDAQPDPVSPLGWSCGAAGSGGGWNALALGVLAGLALLVSRRRPRS